MSVQTKQVVNKNTVFLSEELPPLPRWVRTDNLSTKKEPTKSSVLEWLDTSDILLNRDDWMPYSPHSESNEWSCDYENEYYSYERPSEKLCWWPQLNLLELTEVEYVEAEIDHPLLLLPEKKKCNFCGGYNEGQHVWVYSRMKNEWYLGCRPPLDCVEDWQRFREYLHMTQKM